MAVNIKNSSLETENIKTTLMKYVKYWYVFLITIIVCLAATYFYILTITPQYKVSSTLFIQEDKNGAGVSKGTAFSDLDLFQTSKTVVNEMEILRSRDLIYKVLKGLALETAYFEKGQFRDIELYGKDLPIKVTVLRVNQLGYQNEKLKIEIFDNNTFALKDGDNKKNARFGKIIETPNYTIKVDKGPAFNGKSKPISIHFKNLTTLTEAYSLTKLKIMPVVKDANTIVLSMVDNVPQRGIDILTKLIESYNLQNVANKNIMAVNSIKFIDERLKKLVADLSQVEGDVESYKQQNMVADLGVDAQMNVTKSGEYSQMLANSDIQLGMIKSLESYFNNSGPTDLLPGTMGIKDPALSDLASKYNALLLEKSQMLRSANPDNPLVLNINDQLLKLKSNIRQNLNALKRGINIERSNILANTYKFNSKIKSAPAIERGLLERSREQSVKANLYNYLLQKREETSLSLSSTIPTAQIVANPSYDSIPDSPKKDLFYLCAFIVGFSIPAATIFTKSMLNTKVKDSSDIEMITGVRLLGELSHNQEESALLALNDRRSTISELFRYIRINLGFMTTNHPNKVLMITSSMKGEGKTFFSINLGKTLATLDKKVVILEFDLRKPDLVNSIGIKSDVGITDYLSSETIDIDDIIKPSGLSPNLFIIGCGAIPDNPSDFVMNTKNYHFFELLKEKFDYVIVDTSPVGQVADAFSLAPYSDVSIYIVRYNYTDKYHLNILQDIYTNNKLKNPMVVFNDAKKDNKHMYGYGYGDLEYTMERAQ